MNQNSIPKQILQNLHQIGEETGKEIKKQAGEVVHAVISPKELLGDIKPKSQEEMMRMQGEEEKKKQEEMQKLRAQISEPGRKVEQEMEQIRREKEQKEKEEEEAMLKQVQARREQERAEMAAVVGGGESTNPAKQKKSRGSAFVQGKKKSQQPDPSQMSQTSEFKGKID